jgi:Holliday junction resolvasome RuvABC ATP-dependent DNA helicase subunit
MSGLGLAPAAVGPHRRFRPQAQVELFQQIPDVDLHRALGDVHVAGDQLVALAVEQVVEDAAFLFGQPGLGEAGGTILFASSTNSVMSSNSGMPLSDKDDLSAVSERKRGFTRVCQRSSTAA